MWSSGCRWWRGNLEVTLRREEKGISGFMDLSRENSCNEVSAWLALQVEN